MTRAEWLAEHECLTDALVVASLAFYREHDISRSLLAREALWKHARTLPEPERTPNAPSSDLADSIASQYCDPIPAFLRGAS